MPTYPDVPQAPGVPPLPRDPTAPIIQKIVLAVSDVAIIARMFLPSQWGLFNADGSDALRVDSTVSVEYRGDAVVTTAPQERGNFLSYNKVQVPQLVRMSVAVSNGKFLPPGLNFSGIDNTTVLATLEHLRVNPILLTAVTPDAVYENVTVMHYEYRRTAQNNATMLVCDVWVQEVRLPGGSQFTSSNTKSPSSPDAVNVGTVQPLPQGGQFANELPFT